MIAWPSRLYAALTFVALAASLSGLPSAAAAATWKAGAAKVVITPEQPMWMSGYASRTHPAEGKLHDLWAKALVLEDPAGGRIALVSLDLVGIDRATSLAIRNALRDKFALDHDRTALACSHTHSGPVVGNNLTAMYFLDAQQARLVQDYTVRLQENIVRVVGEAFAALAPAELSWTTGQATFAVNRRTNPEKEVPKLQIEGKIRGPRDHDLPVLAVRATDGALKAVLCGYACHATVLDGYQWSGDYPGFAQAVLEQSHPGSIALFFAGCGADQNPLPRRQVALAEKYGRQLSEGVDKALAAPMRPIVGTLRVSYSEVEIPFAKIPDRDQLLQASRSADKFEASRARLLLSGLDRDGTISQSYPYPIQVWCLGSELTLVTLGGEVVVDYALRIKQELQGQAVWIAAYANDVMAYIPSRRVLGEGGYEGGGAMVYYGLPSAWAPEVEETIVHRVLDQAKRTQSGAP